MSIDKIEAGDELSHSGDQFQDNIEKLKELFPQVVAEGKVDFEALRQILGDEVESDEEYYRFTWAGKSKARLEAHKPSTGTLRPVREESLNWDDTKNLYIEGDNLEVLKLLQKSYSGRVKMIYIDPPYNTGKDFVYSDDYKDSLSAYLSLTGSVDQEGNKLSTNTESDGRYHSNWLNMIFPRLYLARNLLTDDGVILVNMDEHEIVNLLKVLNEVFGENNDLGTIIWDKRNPKGDSKGLASQHEYIACYARDKKSLLSETSIKRPKKNAERILAKAADILKRKSNQMSLDEVNKEFAEWVNSQDFSGGEKAYNRIDDKGRVYQSVSMAWPNKKKAPEDYFVPLIHPETKLPCPVPPRGWRNPSATMKRLHDEGLILFGVDETTQPRRKYLLVENMHENIPSLLYHGGSDTELLASMAIPFDTPKVVEICKEHIRAFTNDGDLILDFFSGSATTAHAVMELNCEEKAKRRFIQVQLPEPVSEKSEAFEAGFKTISEIGRKRIAAAAKAIRQECQEEFDGGFRLFKLDTSNIIAWTGGTNNLNQELFDVQDNIKEGRSSDDILFEILLKYGLDLNNPIESKEFQGNKLYSIGYGALIVCMDDSVESTIVDGIAKWKAELKPEVCRVVLRDSAMNDVAKTNIYQALKRIGVNEVRSI